MSMPIPIVRGPRLYDELAKAWERLDEARSQDLCDAIGIDGLSEPEQRVDDIGSSAGRCAAQPCRNDSYAVHSPRLLS
jgi:hypothetical protein